ncbi:hypothetical protein KFE25_008657 [Diacronema lutheri]|uniref:Homeobox domain-containing protein n=2 Tax=Diacronema lutheri TaxID=2081491 RepID=A0A8J5XWC2_DIALT|nr:hypothetical protein KFE25_008657 [Diacronema lutheri]
MATEEAEALLAARALSELCNGPTFAVATSPGSPLRRRVQLLAPPGRASAAPARLPPPQYERAATPPSAAAAPAHAKFDECRPPATPPLQLARPSEPARAPAYMYTQPQYVACAQQPMAPAPPVTAAWPHYAPMRPAAQAYGYHPYAYACAPVAQPHAPFALARAQVCPPMMRPPHPHPWLIPQPPTASSSSYTTHPSAYLAQPPPRALPAPLPPPAQQLRMPLPPTGLGKRKERPTGASAPPGAFTSPPRAPSPPMPTGAPGRMLTREQQLLLAMAFSRDPYPPQSELDELVRGTGMTLDDVRHWLASRRMLKSKLQLKIDEQKQGKAHFGHADGAWPNLPGEMPATDAHANEAGAPPKDQLPRGSMLPAQRAPHAQVDTPPESPLHHMPFSASPPWATAAPPSAWPQHALPPQPRGYGPPLLCASGGQRPA